LKKTVKAVARFLDRVNRALGTGLIGKRVGNVLQQKTEAVRCFGTSIVVEETGSTVRDDGVTGDEHRRSVAVSYGQIRRQVVVQIRMALDAAGEEVVGPGGAEMVVNVSNGVPCRDLDHVTMTSTIGVATIAMPIGVIEVVVRRADLAVVALEIIRDRAVDPFKDNGVKSGLSFRGDDNRCVLVFAGGGRDSREEFCLVSGLKFGVENSTDYNKEKDPIPFRRRVVSSDLDGRPIRGKDVGLLIESDVFKKLDDNDAVSLCCVGILQLVLLGVEDRRHVPNWILSDPTNETDTKSYSIEGFAWVFKTWILESFRAATDDY
nr:phospholipase-like protein [Tanacetum cinerariifolium]